MAVPVPAAHRGVLMKHNDRIFGSVQAVSYNITRSKDIRDVLAARRSDIVFCRRKRC